MEKRNIIVIGASAGGFEALKRLVEDLPSDLEAAICQRADTGLTELIRRDYRTLKDSALYFAPHGTP